MTQPTEQWRAILEIVERARKTTGHFAVASVDRHGIPNITPVGTVFFREDGTAFYFDRYTRALAENLATNPHVCLLAVDRGPLFWFRSLALGRFGGAPGVRLYGTVGPLRRATAPELDRVRRRVRPMRLLPGGRLLWSGFDQVRDITFTSARLVRYPAMMSHLPDIEPGACARIRAPPAGSARRRDSSRADQGSTGRPAATQSWIPSRYLRTLP
ncbi:pyridoxamine 5'-phosphate oxidase family protein [Nocardia thailandica]|uniref:Pyridoxamine 5'-phosphate oxidase family protein n=1 Tax=Nocardia thailandica TaxID=257275 RepID=A0ABW6PXE9_9NOCA